MLILTIKTDQPEAEIALYQDNQRIEADSWHAHRQLAVTLHQHIADLLGRHQASLEDLEGVVAFQGPGSFTGLRIGLSVANALAEGLQVPAIGAKGNQWQAAGITELLAGKGTRVVLPEYGADPHITQQRK